MGLRRLGLALAPGAAGISRPILPARADINCRAPDSPRNSKDMAEKTNTDVKTMPFETAIAELETIVRELEGGKVPLEQSVAMYERGEVLKARCEELLKQAEARVEKITLDAGGKPTGSEPLDVD